MQNIVLIQLYLVRREADPNSCEKAKVNDDYERVHYKLSNTTNSQSRLRFTFQLVAIRDGWQLSLLTATWLSNQRTTYIHSSRLFSPGVSRNYRTPSVMILTYSSRLVHIHTSFISHGAIIQISFSCLGNTFLNTPHVFNFKTSFSKCFFRYHIFSILSNVAIQIRRAQDTKKNSVSTKNVISSKILTIKAKDHS